MTHESIKPGALIKITYVEPINIRTFYSVKGMNIIGNLYDDNVVLLLEEITVEEIKERIKNNKILIFKKICYKNKIGKFIYFYDKDEIISN